ncbi:GMC oxidoreductase [Lacibacter sediminis]|uniref:GMC family oxidoreductase n=1 Tax=Lacibacter sediminis TaxID=2760713 RepID=A0A7G5XG38_9BACT|nr:GMC family oxidoreductase [Lacibacter sediminis]QNA44441.1 GMC family oxidoreductase [Lacibacter sediminis]
MADNTFDAIVIGSGISGGWAAKELCEKGLKVLMLERGAEHKHITDYKTASKMPWEFDHRGKTTQQQKEDYPVIHRGWAANERVMDAWANEKDSPYTEVKPFTWWRSYRMGGRSVLWGRHSYRWSELDFEANAKDGFGIDWPIRYNDIAPWYDHVEKFAGISGSLEGLPHLPDGQFLPPVPLNIVEKDVAAKIKAFYKGERHLINSRVANITVPHDQRPGCQFRNRCWEGCPFGGYFSTQSSTLPAAVKTNNLTVRPLAIVTKILYDKDKKKATGVEVLDSMDSKTYEFKAKIIFVCASALNSTWLLFNSATDIWPGGLGSSSGELGHNVMDHHYNLGVSGEIEGYENVTEYGRRPAGFYISRFANTPGDKQRNFVRGYGYQGSASRQGWGRVVAELAIGSELKEALAEPGGWRIGATGFGEILPYHENKISLDKEVKDKWGLPVLSMDAELKENEKNMRKDIKEDLQAMFEAAGVKNISTYDSGHAMGHGIHEMGTARMGRDPKTSVLNRNNQVWDAPNVFVTDGACMTSSSCVNPSLTYMALTARAADFAVKELKKGNI